MFAIFELNELAYPQIIHPLTAAKLVAKKPIAGQRKSPALISSFCIFTTIPPVPIQMAFLIYLAVYVPGKAQALCYVLYNNQLALH